MSQAQKLPDFSLMTKEEMESFIKEQMAKANATIEAQRKEHQEQLDKQLKIINNLRQENSAHLKELEITKTDNKKLTDNNNALTTIISNVLTYIRDNQSTYSKYLQDENIPRLDSYDLFSINNYFDKANNKKFRFTLTTNGVLLDDDILEFANKEMSNLVLSLDGRKEVHDLMRPRRGGQGSYDTVVPKFIKAAESRNQMNYYVRGTYTRNNLDFAKDVIHMADLGFEQISVEPVVADKSESYVIREEDSDTLIKQYDELTAEMIKRKKEGKPFNFFHFMIDLSGGPCVAKRLSGCGSGTEYLAVSPSGELYPCHQFMGMKDFLLGNVDEGVIRTDIRDEFKLCNVYAKEKCKNCFAKFYCSGGCAANSYNFSGSINGTYEIGCELQKKRIECAIALKALEFNE